MYANDVHMCDIKSQKIFTKKKSYNNKIKSQNKNNIEENQEEQP